MSGVPSSVVTHVPVAARLPRLWPGTLRARIAEAIRDAILIGDLPAGGRIVERKLAAEMGASLTAVREAIIELEAQGFIVKRANATTHVTALSLEDAEQILSVRRALEPMAAEEAARRASPDELQALTRIYEEMTETARARDARAFVLRDLAWHESIWRASGNPHLEAGLRRVLLPFFAHAAIRIVGGQAQGIDLARDARLHLPILQALRARDPRRARAAMAAAVDTWTDDTRTELYIDKGKSRRR